MNVTDIYYDFPQAAYLFFFVLLFLVLFWFFYQYRQRILSHYTSEKKLSELLIPEPNPYYWLKVFAICLAWICLALAFMQPKGNARYPQALSKASQNVNSLRMQPHEVIFLMDASASMSVKDGRLGQTRLENAKNIADEVMSHLQGQSGSLYAFTSEVSKLSPPSMDYLFMRLMLRNMTINENDVTGTDFKKALQSIHDNYLDPATALIKTLILFSDGEDNRLAELKGAERDKYIQELLQLLGETDPEKLYVYTIGLGTLQGGTIPQLTYEGKSVVSHLQEDLLKALSAKGNGRYYTAQEYSAADIAADLAQQIAKTNVFAPFQTQTEINPKEDLIYDLYYQFPLGIALLLLSFYLFWPNSQVANKGIKTEPIVQISRIVLMFFLIGGFLHANDSIEDQLRLGASYFDVNDFPAAINIYQKLLNEELTEWEKSVVTYNLGTALTAQGSYEKALNYLQQLSLNKEASPLLMAYARQNLAIANFRNGLFLSKALNTNSPLTQDPFFKAIYFFQQALDEISLAQETRCNLLYIAGEASCEKEENLEKMEALSKVKVAELREKARKNLIEHASLQNGLPWLLTGLELLGQDIQWMQESARASEKGYPQLLKEHSTSWLPLWNALSTKFKDNQKFATIFKQAQFDFNKMIESGEKGDFKAAKSELTSSKRALNRLIRLIFAADPLQEIISKLLNDFSLASLQDPLESNTLLFLQQELNEITLSKEKEDFKASINVIKDHLERSLSYIQSHQEILSHLYFNEAWQQLKRVFILFRSDLNDNPEVVLEAAIDEQRHALAQTRYLSRLTEKQEKLPSTARTFIINSEQFLLAFAKYFYDSSYARAVKDFNADIPSEGEDLRCQYHPWNEVVPLFEKGLQGVKKSITAFKMEVMDLNTAMQNQEETLNKWNEALEKLRSPKQGGTCRVTAQIQPDQKEKSPTESFENVARLIQEMNMDDKQPITPTSGSVKEGLKPW